MAAVLATYDAPVRAEPAPLPIVDRTFRPDIEGLRAIAVLLVIAAHSGLGPFSGGFVGVDVFFVLSGFLITGLLLKSYEAEHRISLAGFYARRVRRILPAATLVLLATLIGSYVYLSAPRATHIAGDAQMMSVGGVLAIFVAGLAITPSTPFPSYTAALPVGGAALVVAGGTIAPGGGAEVALRLGVFQWRRPRSL